MHLGGTKFTLPASGFSYLLSGSEYQVAVNALATDGRLKVLATPRVYAYRDGAYGYAVTVDGDSVAVFATSGC